MVRKRESINNLNFSTRNMTNKGGNVTSVRCILVFVVVIESLLLVNNSFQGAIQI